MTEISDEIVQRMATLVRRMADGGDGPAVWGHEVEREAMAIADKLPKPVDPDVLILREILATWMFQYSPAVRAGEGDNTEGFQAALKIYKFSKNSGGVAHCGPKYGLEPNYSGSKLRSTQP